MRYILRRRQARLFDLLEAITTLEKDDYLSRCTMTYGIVEKELLLVRQGTSAFAFGAGLYCLRLRFGALGLS